MLSTLSADSPTVTTISTCDNHAGMYISPPSLSDADILSVVSDLFAGRTDSAFGETIDWWAETFQCDLGPKAAAGVVLVAISKWPFDQRAGAHGVNELQAELVKRARQILARGVLP